MALQTFADKRAGETRDYVLSVTDRLSDGEVVATATVEIIGTTVDESPFALSLGSPELVLTSSGSPQQNDEFTVTLSGGTPGATYYLRFEYDTTGQVRQEVVAIRVTGDVYSTLVVEDGTVVDGANVFASLSYVDNYHGVRGDTVWLTAAYEERAKAMIRAADYIEQRFRTRWLGSRVNGEQRLSWPRRGVYKPDVFDPYYRQNNVPFEFRNTVFIEENVVPDEVLQLQAILAREVLDGTGTVGAALQGNFDRATKREQLGDLEVEYFGPEGGGDRLATIYWAAENIVKPYLRSRSIGQSYRG